MLARHAFAAWAFGAWTLYLCAARLVGHVTSPPWLLEAAMLAHWALAFAEVLLQWLTLPSRARRVTRRSDA